MAANRPAGTIAVAFDCPIPLYERFVAFLERTGAKRAETLRLALTRHLDHPPPETTSPGFPDSGNGPPAAPKPRKPKAR
jgi:hypothetical protein